MRKSGMLTSQMVLAVVFGLSFRAATCEDRTLLELLPVDTAAVIHVDSPGNAWSELKATPFWQRVEESTLFNAWLASPSSQKWASVQDYSRKQTGRSVSEHFLTVASQEAALALFLPEGRDPQGVLMTRAANPEAVTAFLDDWNRLEGDARLEPASREGGYFRRVRSGSHKVLFVLRSGTILAISDQEGIISDLQSRLSAAKTDGFAESPREKRLRSAFATEARLTLSINPARWKPLLGGNTGEENSGIEWLMSRVDAMDAIGLSLRTAGAKPGAAPAERTCLELELIVQSSGSLANSQVKSTVRRQWPASTVLAASGTLLLSDWWPLIRRVSSKSEQAEWQKVRRVGRGILGGDDPVPSLLGDRAMLLEGLVFASPVRGLDGRLSAVFADSSAARRDRWIRVIRLIGQLLTIDHNRHADRPEVVMHEDATAEMTRFWIEGPSLVWFPTVTAALDQVVVDSHPDSAKTAAAVTGSAGQNPTVVASDPSQAAIQANAHPLLFVWWNAAALRNHLRTTDVATLAWERRDQTLIGLPVMAAAAVFQMTDLFDRAQLGVRVDGGTARARVTLEVDPIAAP